MRWNAWEYISTDCAICTMISCTFSRHLVEKAPLSLNKNDGRDLMSNLDP